MADREQKKAPVACCGLLRCAASVEAVLHRGNDSGIRLLFSLLTFRSSFLPRASSLFPKWITMPKAAHHHHHVGALQTYQVSNGAHTKQTLSLLNNFKNCHRLTFRLHNCTNTPAILPVFRTKPSKSDIIALR